MDYYGFEAPPVVYGRIISTGLSDPIEGDYGTYRRVLVDYVPINEDDPTQNGEPATLYLPMPKGYPRKVSPRSTLAKWLRTAMEALGESHPLVRKMRSVSGAEAALKALEGQWVRMAEMEYDAGRGRKKVYFTPTDVYANRDEAVSAMLAEFADDDVDDEAEDALEQDEFTRAKQAWEALAALPDEARETAFRAMQWETNVDALLAAVKG